jgi:hypothetical protein
VEPYRHLFGLRRWRRVSALVIARAGGRCEVTPSCPRPAVSADHIVPALVLAERGRLDLFFAEDNLRASCLPCNSRRGAALRNARSRGAPRRRRVVSVDAERAAIEWAAEYEADALRLERERREVAHPGARQRMPRIC